MRSSPDENGGAAKGPFFAFAPDANSLIRLEEKGRERLYLVTQFEYHTEAPSAVDGNPPIQMYAQLPMAMNLAALRQNGKTGRLQATKLSNIDMGPINGLWIPLRRLAHAVEHAPGRRGVRTLRQALRERAARADEPLPEDSREDGTGRRGEGLRLRPSRGGFGGRRGPDEGGPALRHGTPRG